MSRRYEGIVLDVDGVITRTARVHAAAWKCVFDDLLERTATGRAEEPVLFDAERDYLQHVDGKPRLDGVRDFLASRGITLPDESERTGQDSVRAIGDRKNEAFHALLRERPVERFESTVELMRLWRERGFRLAAVSSSRNARAVLESAAVVDLLDVLVDGSTAHEVGLPGKPEPHVFSEAARRLAVDPSRLVAIEDAISGVRSARSAGYALVIGVDREGTRDDLLAAGAHLVVRDLSELDAEVTG